MRDTRNRSARLISCFAALAFVTAGLAAQAPASAPQKPPSSQAAQPADQQPTFRVTVNLVTTDVIPRDRNGQFLADLTKDDFEVLEDGTQQEIAALTLIHGGRAYNYLAPPPPPVQEGIILPPSRPTNDAAGRIFILFVDDLHLDFRNTGRIRELFKKISKTLIHEGDMFGIVSTGPSSLAIDLTYDRRRLDDAIKRISGSALRPDDIIQGPDGAEGPSEVRYRAHVAFSTAYELVQNLEKLTNRRKAVVYVSNGYDFDPFPKGRLGEDPIFGGRFGANQSSDPDNPEAQSQSDPFNRQRNVFADADLARELAELTRAANRANATVYTVDPRGLVGGPDIDDQVDPVEWGNFVRKTQDSLRVLADETGGLAVVNQNDFDKALKRIDAETSDYYVLGYYSKNSDPTKRTRQIEVKVKRDGIDVRYRRAYSLKPPPAPVSPER